MDRRQFLSVVGVGALAGCASGDQRATGGPSVTETATADERETNTTATEIAGGIARFRVERFSITEGARVHQPLSATIEIKNVGAARGRFRTSVVAYDGKIRAPIRVSIPADDSITVTKDLFQPVVRGDTSIHIPEYAITKSVTVQPRTVPVGSSVRMPPIGELTAERVMEFAVEKIVPTPNRLDFRVRITNHDDRAQYTHPASQFLAERERDRKLPEQEPPGQFDRDYIKPLSLKLSAGETVSGWLSVSGERWTDASVGWDKERIGGPAPEILWTQD